MHVYYKFGLLLIFIFSVSTCCTRAAPATNQSAYDDYNDYDEYYDETAGDSDAQNASAAAAAANEANRLTPLTGATVTTALYAPFFGQIDIPKRSNHVLEPNCPKACLCLEDYKFIQCSNARLTHVPRDLPSTTLHLDLSHNRISELHAHEFANCSKVREINLSGNLIKELHTEVFSGLRRLQRLNLANNHLNYIEPDTFAAAAELSKLDLSNNTIALHKDGSFLNQPSLLELYCRNCTWSKLYDDTFTNLSSLTALKLEHNDFNKKINTKAFTPLRNLIKLKLPELDQSSIQELCNLLKSIDNISFKHFDVSCFELVLGASFNESLILTTDPPFIAPSTVSTVPPLKQQNDQQTFENLNTQNAGKPLLNMTTEGHNDYAYSNLTLPLDGAYINETKPTILTASVVDTVVPTKKTAEPGKGQPYQVPISQETINIMLISIMIIAIIGILIGIICRKDVGGIKTKCCRTRIPEPKDQVHPTEEIPLNKLA